MKAVDLNNALKTFYSGNRTAEVAIVVNDSVEILRRDGNRRRGTAITLLSIGTGNRYLVELDDGSEVEVVQSKLRLVD